MKNEVLNNLNEIRRSADFLTIEETLHLSERGNIILDPFSLLISRQVEIGENNIFYPNVVIQSQLDGKITIKNKNTFFLNTFILADKGCIGIGNENQFGDGGCSIKANNEAIDITIGDHGRYLNGAQIIGKTNLGSGSQIIGAITVQDCTLEGGESYKNLNPDERGAVLKGAGVARNILLRKGEVINAYGIFKEAPVETQYSYHPK